MRRVAIVLSVLGVSLLAPSTAAATRSEFFGIAQGPTLDGQDLRGMAAARVRTNRFMLTWGWVQPNPGSFNWDPTDRFIGRLASRGIRVVPALWGNPDWVYGSPARPPLDTPHGVQAWRDFLKALVARYGPGGSYWAAGYQQQHGAGAPRLPIRSWQIWNEPNLHKYFAPYPSAKTYARLLGISHDAIRSVDPRAQIVLAGMPGFGDLNAWDFLDRLYSVAGIKNKFEAAALHPYARDVDRQRLEIARFRAVMRKRLDQATPLWLTEVAWGSAPPDSFGINKGLTGQAQMLSDSFRMVLSHRSAWNVQRLFWFRWRDPRASQGGGCSFCASSGLLNYNRTQKPAYSRLTDFVAEVTPPQASITAGPGRGGFIKDPTPSFSFTSNEPGSTFVCRVDGSAFKPCSSPYTTPLLSNGNHLFFVRAIDAPGNQSQIVWRYFTVDTQAPSVTISSGPANGSTPSERSPSFSFASNEPASFSCQLDGAGFDACNSPFTASGLADASHTFQVRATDRAGNQGPAASRTWTVDGSTDLSISAGPQNGELTNDPTPSFAFSSTDSSASFSCQLDGGGFDACTSPLTTSTLSDGDHTFTVKAATAQNTVAVSRAFTVDATAPAVTISSGPADGSATNDSTPTFRFSSTEPESTFQCRYDAPGFSGCSGASSDTVASSLSDGPHTFYVRAIDAAGNLGDELYIRFVVDTAAPELEIRGLSKTKTNEVKAAATFTLKASERVGRRCRIDSKRFQACSWRYRTPKLRRGTHTLKVKATDRAGNAVTRRKRFKIARQLLTGVRLTAASAPLHPRCHRVAATLIGSPHGDRLVGTNGPDVIVGFGGDDKINGRGGRDRICARRGDDQVTAGWGEDRILGGPGSDHVWGGAGRDMIRGASGFDRCWGAAAIRRFRCEDGS